MTLLGDVSQGCADGRLRGGFGGSGHATIDDALADRPDRASAWFGLRCAW